MTATDIEEEAGAGQATTWTSDAAVVGCAEVTGPTFH